MEKSAFLFAMQRVIGGIQVQYDLGGGCDLRFYIQLHEKLVG